MERSSFLNRENKNNIWSAKQTMFWPIMFELLSFVTGVIILISVNYFVLKQNYYVLFVLLGLLDLYLIVYVALGINYSLSKYLLWHSLYSDVDADILSTETITGVVDSKDGGDYPELGVNLFSYNIVLDERLWKGGKKYFVDKKLYSLVETTDYGWSIKDQKELGKLKLGTKVKIEYLVNSKVVVSWQVIN